MKLAAINTTLQAVGRVITEVRDNFTNYYTTKSLPEATKLTRVEPLTIVSRDLLNTDYLKDVNQALLSLFAAYYLQAVSVLSTINDVEVIRVLDSLNPDRDETGFLFGEKASTEAHVSTSLENYKYELPTSKSVALELDKSDKEQLNNVTNLSVGKMLDVNMQYKKDTADKEQIKITVPVSVRLMVSLLPTASITHILAFKTEDTSLVERFHAWRSGRISFIKDLIFCQDLIDEYKKAIIKDETDTMEEIMRRVNNSKKFGLLTKNPSLVSASNLFVVSEVVAKEIESKLGGRLSNFKVREKAFDNTYAMIIAVVDREWDRVTFYTRGIKSSTDLSVKEIQNSGKGKGADIGDILKSFQMGMGASF